jgi:hypothetical protein
MLLHQISPEHLRISSSSTELLIMLEMWAVVRISAMFAMAMLTLMTHVQRGRVRKRLQ